MGVALLAGGAVYRQGAAARAAVRMAKFFTFVTVQTMRPRQDKETTDWQVSAPWRLRIIDAIIN